MIRLTQGDPEHGIAAQLAKLLTTDQTEGYLRIAERNVRKAMIILIFGVGLGYFGVGFPFLYNFLLSRDLVHSMDREFMGLSGLWLVAILMVLGGFTYGVRAVFLLWDCRYQVLIMKRVFEIQEAGKEP